ncbi:MAG TPA: hypothetical protein PK753_05420 [Ignavibacteria bacterium]|nr:hypothetical protein [Ignavibacteria bacterium]
MIKTSLNNFRGKRMPIIGSSAVKADKNSVLYSENFYKEELVLNLRARMLAICIFLYYFIENGTMGLVPQKFYMVYRSVRLSDMLLYGMILYSFFYWREYRDLLKSRSFLVVKILLAYFLFEFAVSAFRYGFSPLEYFMRLKGIWTSFLVFPYLLLLKRGGFSFLIKLIFPVAIISNLLYVITALTGIPFLPDVSIIRQQLPGDIEVFRVFGGTFFGELYFLGIVYFWITNRFRAWQLGLAALFIIPHILAFGRLAWIGFIFTILVMIILNSLNKRNYHLLLRQAVILIVLGIAVIFAFIKFIPESDFYVDALNARIFQGQEDVKHSEGTYGTRVIMQNNALVSLWLNNDIFLGIGMHPMWVLGPETKEEIVYYGAFCDVSWPGTLAAYGLIGFALACFIQFYYAWLSLKLIRRSKENTIFTFMLTLLFAKLVFDSTVGFSYVFLTTGLWGLFNLLNVYIPIVVYSYEDAKKKGII